jgi:DNA-binding LacI/PurR family transcriptional regulator
MRRKTRSGAASAVTIRQVAEESGFSVTTVSHALTGRRPVPAKTRQRVVAAAEALGYTPNRSAQNLRLGQTRTLALLMPGLATDEDTSALLAADFYVTVAGTVARRAFSEDYAVILLPPPEAGHSFATDLIDGAIIVDPFVDDLRLAAFEDAGVPTVTIERDPGRPDFKWWVAPDNSANALMVLEHLTEQGARRIALLTSGEDAGWALENEQRYRSWCAERSQRPIVARASMRDLDRSTDRALSGLLERKHKPDALFAVAEIFAPAALRAATARGIAVPRQLRIASGADSRAAQLSNPALTAIDARPEAQAIAAVELLLRRLTGAKGAGRRIAGELRIRESTQA